MLVAQLSDTHISDQEADAATDDLARAVAHLLRLPVAPDVVLVTGDCVNHGTPAEYARFQHLLSPLPMPVYVIPGNHDDRTTMLELFGAQGTAPLAGSVQYVVDDLPVRLLALDTHVPGGAEGMLGDERLAWLDTRLREAPARPTLVLMHHPPFPLGLAVPDAIGLIDAAALGSLIARHPQVERITAGHVHMSTTRRFHGTIAMTCPSTSHQMVPDWGRPERLVVAMEPPACLLHVWNEHSGLVTYTSAIGEHGPLVELHDGTHWVP